MTTYWSHTKRRWFCDAAEDIVLDGRLGSPKGGAGGEGTGLLSSIVVLDSLREDQFEDLSTYVRTQRPTVDELLRDVYFDMRRLNKRTCKMYVPTSSGYEDIQENAKHAMSIFNIPAWLEHIHGETGQGFINRIHNLALHVVTTGYPFCPTIRVTAPGRLREENRHVLAARGFAFRVLPIFSGARSDFFLPRIPN